MTLIPEIEASLLSAVRARQRASRRRLVAAPVATVALVSLAVVVALGALVLLSGQHHATPTSPGAAHEATSRRQLLDTLAVLRRPQAHPGITASRLRSLVARRGTLDGPLVRTVTVPSLRERVALLPLSSTAGAQGPNAERLAVSFLGPTRGAQAPVSEAIGVRQLRTHGISAVSAPTVNDHVLVVPDGVVRVTINRVTVNGGRRLELAPHRLGGRTAAVHDNVAGFALGPLIAENPGRASLLGFPALAQTTWFGADGRVVSRPTVNLIVWVLFPSVRHAGGASASKDKSAFCASNPRLC